ncbi:hypothetical protein CKY28_15445 [Sphingomonas lenta]|uniref:EamA domain-containing protein n=2 Tax=Sphingomonas lenta TaxID=1141887 RepID=A0A2A2SCQ8_9SPHN|nr:hypothetical protein CKY28_15445 [Sphingomonas lenta]
MGVDVLVGRAVLSASAAVLVSPALLFAAPPDAATWGALAVAMPAHFAYQLCLVRAMGRGELSLVFPVMRGAAPLLTAVAAAALLGEGLHPLGWAGLVAATGALLVFAWPPEATGLRAHPDRAGLGWALATAVGVALYNTADARGVRVAPEPLTYIVWLFLLDAVPITVLAVATRRRALRAALEARWRYGVAAGGLSVLSFGSALYAFSLLAVAKVSALRETSVVWAALLGGRVLGEAMGRRRVAAAALLAGGLVLMQFAPAS